MNQTKMRNHLVDRLNFLVTRIGSIKGMADLMGVHRVQMSRFLNGTSTPRAEILASFAQALDIPLGWFFEGGDIQKSLSEAKFGFLLQKLATQRQFEVPSDYLPVGFYIFWKQMFADTGRVEALLAKVSGDDGVYTLKMSMTRILAKIGKLDPVWEKDRYCQSALFLSSRNLTMISLDGRENVLIIGSMQKPIFNRVRARHREVFAGNFYCPVFNTPTRVQFVKGILEKIDDNTSSVLEAARLCGRPLMSEIPQHILEIFDDIPDGPCCTNRLELGFSS